MQVIAVRRGSLPAYTELADGNGRIANVRDPRMFHAAALTAVAARCWPLDPADLAGLLPRDDATLRARLAECAMAEVAAPLRLGPPETSRDG